MPEHKIGDLVYSIPHGGLGYISDVRENGRNGIIYDAGDVYEVVWMNSNTSFYFKRHIDEMREFYLNKVEYE